MDLINETLKQRLPGIRLTSVIQGYALLNEFAEGIRCFQRLITPTPADLRWAGVCYFSTFDDDKALELYSRAIDAGESAARINLAHSLAFVDRADEVLPQLEQVHFGDLEPYDKVLYLRVKSLHDERDGNLQEALRHAETAWRLIQGLPEFHLLAPRLLNQLGILHGRVGRAQRALWYLDRNLEIAEGKEKVRVLLTRVRVLIALGGYDEAERELAKLASMPEEFEAIALIRQAEMHWARGDINVAKRVYKHARSRAESIGLAFEQFQASIDLATLDGYLGETNSAVTHLKRAQRLISDQSDRLHFRFREVLIRCWSDEYTPSHAVAELRDTAAQFGSMGLLQEQGWVRVHIAGLSVHEGAFKSATTDLDALHALSITLQNNAFLDREWVLLPRLREYALRHYKGLVSH